MVLRHISEESSKKCEQEELHKTLCSVNSLMPHLSVYQCIKEVMRYADPTNFNVNSNANILRCCKKYLKDHT